MAADLAEVFRLNVRSRMADLGLTQTALSERLGVTPSFVSQLLSGHRRPGLDSLQEFAKALHCEPSELIRAAKKAKVTA